MNDDTQRNTAPWYIMCHLNPELIRRLLTKDREGKFCDDENRPVPFEFFIPYLHAPMTDVRGDFHRLVFIQATAEGIATLVDREWNKSGRLHLYYYRNHEGREILVDDHEVQRLKRAFLDANLNFYIDQPIEAFEKEDVVILNVGPWAGHEGVIIEKKISKGKVNMTIGLNVCNLTESINFTDLKSGDVTFADPDRRVLLSDNPIQYFEEEIIDILSHRYNKSTSPEVEQKDTARLKRLTAFERIFIDETDADYFRFLSLRLICATLLGSTRKEQLLKQIERVMAGKPQPATDAEAYMMTALFIATKNPQYRNAVKDYRENHPSAPDVLRRYASITKKIRAKKTDIPRI